MESPESSASLPAPLRGTDAGSFTHHTIARRWPRIADRVVAENDFPDAINARIQALRNDLPDGSIRPLRDEEAPDAGLWTEYVAPHRGKTWLEAPWFFGETYFYRRLLEATGYFRSGAGARVDPFASQKDQGLVQTADRIGALAERRMRALDEGEGAGPVLTRLFRSALWGNQADLSMWAADEEGPAHDDVAQAEEHLLVDDTATALLPLENLERPARVDIWADNAGFELVSDLALVDGLLAAEAVGRVTIHLKAHPTFVSDATVGDVHATVQALADADRAPVRALARRLQTALASGRLRLRDAWVWTSPLRARALPLHVRADLARADLLISKGDANYRRLLGDRHWAFTTPFEEAVAPLPVPVVALRTHKSEVAAGLSRSQVDRLDEQAPDWSVNGEWGVIQSAPVDPSPAAFRPATAT
ncbi:damage-control phosphatase ARMT1 family protein [Salinibacter altiplanensis]|uniref:damage-control phosphatase ARMT1 family protein n=1 Tax=Salinibacter altiplanensis TaxID=1803181 RepID=UPI001E5F742F|nr:damage-control phosphatase ARMT1 family protein [Salinibacter altiplanensis]